MPTRIIPERCSSCGACVFQCGGSVYGFRVKNDTLFVEVCRVKSCVDCCICMELCPENAIELFFKGVAYSLSERNKVLH